jgi:hypothetical protein
LILGHNIKSKILPDLIFRVYHQADSGCYHSYLIPITGNNNDMITKNNLHFSKHTISSVAFTPNINNVYQNSMSNNNNTNMAHIDNTCVQAAQVAHQMMDL